MSGREALRHAIANQLAAEAGSWNGYNAGPNDLYLAMADRLIVRQMVMSPEIAAEIERTARAEATPYWRQRAYRAENVQWDDALAPGGEVCAHPDCGQPVESEPCPEHSPAAELARLRARVAELETEAAAQRRTGYQVAIRVMRQEKLPMSVELLEAELELEALDVPEPRKRSAGAYPPALPWARLMDDADLAEFLAEVEHAIATPGATPTEALGWVERACGTWRLIAEAQHAHNTSPGPDEDEKPDGITRLIAPTQAFRADEATEAGDDR